MLPESSGPAHPPLVLPCKQARPTPETCPLYPTLFQPGPAGADVVQAWVCRCGRVVGPMSTEEIPVETTF